MAGPLINKRQFLRSAARLAAIGATAGGLDLPNRLAAQSAEASGATKENRVARVTATQVNVACEFQAGSFKRPIRLGGVVAEVETTDGLTGHGFSWTNSIVVSTIRDVIAPYLKGKDAMAREQISEELYWRLTPRAETGHAVHAISLIDCALWDIAGKRYREPVWRLLGGARKEIKVYTTCGSNFLKRDELAEVGREVAKSGQNRMKMVVAAGVTGLDRSGKSIEPILAEDAARVRAMREAIGSDAMLSIDANEGLDVYQARHLARQIADFNIGFFEEPLRGNDIHRLADFRREAPMPIAAGQNETQLSRWRDMAENAAVDLLQFNVGSCGGFTAAVKIAGLAQAFGMPIANAGAYAPFNMHLHAGVANGGMCEWHLESVGLCRVLYKGVPELTNGDRLVLPTAPGLGFELNRDALRDFTVKS